MTDTIPTPRTDAVSWEHGLTGEDLCFADFARQLERELAVAMDALNWVSNMDQNGRPVRDELDMFNVAGKTVQILERMRRKYEENK
jgi:hypothetical protein